MPKVRSLYLIGPVILKEMCAWLGTILKFAQLKRVGDHVWFAEILFSTLRWLGKNRLHEAAQYFHWMLFADAMNDDHSLVWRA